MPLKHFWISACAEMTFPDVRDRGPVRLRTATEQDVPALAELYAGSVLALGPEHYTDAQVASWASFASDTDAFRRFVIEPTTFIAQDDTGVLGFCGIFDDGHIASLYVRPDRARLGIGTRLLEAALDYATLHHIEFVNAQASRLSQPLFLKLGFRTVRSEVAQRDGVGFERYLVERRV
jgi:putative acetyltransferase